MAWVKAQLEVPQFVDANGNPAVAGSYEFYVWNTTTPLAVAFDSAGAAQATSVTFNSLGRPQSSGGTAVDLFFSTTASTGYKIIAKDADGVTLSPTIGPFFPPLSAAWTAANLEQVAVSMVQLYQGSWTGINRIRTLSYYAYTPGTNVPRGGALFYRNGNTGQMPTTSGTLLTHLSGGYVNDSDGVQWSIVDDGTLDIYAFGAKSYDIDPTFDNAVCCQAMLDCFDYCRRPPGSFRYTTTYELWTDQWDVGPADSFEGHIGIVDDAVVQRFVGNDGSQSTPHTRIKLAGFKYRLASGDDTATNYHVDARYGYMNEFEDLTFGDQGNGYAKGIWLDDGNCHTLTRCRFLKGSADGFKEAIRMVRTADLDTNSTQTGSLHLIACQFERDVNSATGSTIYLQNVRGFTIDETCHFEQSLIYLYGCAGGHIRPRWFNSSQLIEDIRSYDNDIDVVGKDSHVYSLGWSRVGGKARSMHELVPYRDFRFGTKEGAQITTSYSGAYGAAKVYRYGNTGDDIFFAIHVRSKTDTPPENLQIRIKNDSDVAVESSPTFALPPITGSNVTGADLWRNGYTWWHTENVAGEYLWVDIVDATSGVTRTDVQLIVYACRCVNYNASFQVGGGSNAGWTTAGATATTPQVVLQNTTVTYGAGQLTSTPGSTSGWSMSQQLLLEPGKSYLMIAKGSWTQNPGMKAETFHNSTVANNYLFGIDIYNNNSDTESWMNNKKLIQCTIRQIENDSTTFISIGQLSGHDASAIVFDWIAVVDVTPFSQPTVYETEIAFASLDTTPAVNRGTYFVTANAGATLISQFDGMQNGEEKWVRVNDANTTLDVTGTILKGNNGVDYACGSGDMLHVKMIGGNQYVTIIQA